MQMIAIGMFVLSCLSCLLFFCPSVLLRGVGGLVRGCVMREGGRKGQDILLLALSTYTSFSFLSRWCHWSWSLRRIRFCFAKGWACGVGDGIHGKYIVTPSSSLSVKSPSCTLSIHLKSTFSPDHRCSTLPHHASPCRTRSPVPRQWSLLHLRLSLRGPILGLCDWLGLCYWLVGHSTIRNHGSQSHDCVLAQCC